MKNFLLFALFLIPGWLFSQQVADTSYNPVIQDPVYGMGKGPVVFIDEGHHNFHTMDGRYTAFARLLERDGYVVRPYKGTFEKQGLKEGEILVISNALNEINVQDWYLPNPSAFTVAEIKVLKRWVKHGGSLFLIADHMPMAGAATDLAAGFGFAFSNGFVIQKEASGPDYFNIEDGTLKESLITKGRDSTETVEQIVSFTGQGFRIPDDATPVLVFNEKYVNLMPDTAWVFNERTPSVSAAGWAQGAYKKFGKGRVVVFGEAAMFTAQLSGPQKFRAGMNNEAASENYRLLLNIIHWLDGLLD